MVENRRWGIITEGGMNSVNKGRQHNHKDRQRKENANVADLLVTWVLKYPKHHPIELEL